METVPGSRGAGRRQVLAALTDHGPASRVDLGRRTGLSSSAISLLAQELIAAGLVAEDTAAPDGRRGRGRPAHRLVRTPPRGLVVGVDLGNTHARTVVASVGGEVRAERHVPLVTDRGPDPTLDDVAAEVRAGLAEAGAGLGEVRLAVLGVPAPLEAGTGRVADNNILPRWVGHRPGVELAERLGCEVVVENDANLGALGELSHLRTAGAASGAGDGAGTGEARTSLLYLKLTTGIGAGLVLDGRLYRGTGGTAGEVGHVQVDPAGVLCRCGSRGCLETVVSVPRLLAALAPVTRDDLGPDDLARLVAEGHLGAVRVVTDAGRTVGQAVASLVTVLNPGLVLVGGHLGPVNELMADRVRAAVGQVAQPAAAAQVEVRASALGERSEALGAAALAGDLVVAEERTRLS